MIPEVDISAGLTYLILVGSWPYLFTDAFWHRCPTCNLPEPVNNGGYWREKFDRNLKRDIEKDDLLNQLGWKTFVIWECQIDALDPLKIATESGLIC